MRTVFKLTLPFLIISFYSCAPFKKESQPYLLTKSNITKLNGRYNIAAENEDSRESWPHRNFYTELDRKLFRDTANLDTSKSYTFKVNVVDEKTVNLLYLENGLLFKQRVLKAKLKRDGYVYLRNQNTKLIWFPYICGGIDVTRSRLSVDDRNNLVVDISHHRSGAFMLIAFIGWKTTRYRKIYSQYSAVQ